MHGRVLISKVQTWPPPASGNTLPLAPTAGHIGRRPSMGGRGGWGWQGVSPDMTFPKLLAMVVAESPMLRQARHKCHVSLRCFCVCRQTEDTCFSHMYLVRAARDLGSLSAAQRRV